MSFCSSRDNRTQHSVKYVCSDRLTFTERAPVHAVPFSGRLTVTPSGGAGWQVPHVQHVWGLNEGTQPLAACCVKFNSTLLDIYHKAQKYPCEKASHSSFSGPEKLQSSWKGSMIICTQLCTCELS